MVDDELHACFDDPLRTMGAFPHAVVHGVVADEARELTAQAGVVLLRDR